MKLIRTGIVTYTIDVPEAADTHGLVHEGKLIPGVYGRVTFDGRRGSGGGTYTVHLERDVSKSGQSALPAPVRAPS